jgi:lipoprotein NlpD
MRHRLSYFLLVACFLSISGCINSRDFTSTEAKFYHGGQVLGSYTVEKGDTLFSIAWTYGWDYRELASANSITPPYIIYAGQKIDVSNPRVRRTALKSNTSSRASTRAREKTPASVKRVVKATAEPPQIPLRTTKVWQWPTSGHVIGRFSTKKPQNKGIDIAGEKGEPIKAVAAGMVVYAGKGLRGYGNLVIIKHDTQYLSAYAHASRILVQEKEQINAGQVIAEVGSTGTDKVMLHFEIRRNGRPVNPLLYLPQR